MYMYIYIYIHTYIYIYSIFQICIYVNPSLSSSVSLSIYVFVYSSCIHIYIFHIHLYIFNHILETRRKKTVAQTIHPPAPRVIYVHMIWFKDIIVYIYIYYYTLIDLFLYITMGKQKVKEPYISWDLTFNSTTATMATNTATATTSAVLVGTPSGSCTPSLQLDVRHHPNII